MAGPVPLAGGDRDIDAIVARLTDEFPWMTDVIERIADDFIVSSLAADPWLRFGPILLVGLRVPAKAASPGVWPN